jgi:hypothetical protein
MLKKYRYLWMALGVLIVLSPLGLLATGTAFGEWGMDELSKEIGYIPAGLQQFADVWTYALFPDYSVPGLAGTFFHSAGGYIFSAVLGAGLAAGIMILLGRRVRE